MVTRNVPKTVGFTLAITRLHDGTVLTELHREDGASRSYSFPEKKLLVFSMVDTTIKDAIAFLTGEA
jgi:hypothetical protein